VVTALRTTAHTSVISGPILSVDHVRSGKRRAAVQVFLQFQLLGSTDSLQES